MPLNRKTEKRSILEVVRRTLLLFACLGAAVAAAGAAASPVAVDGTFAVRAGDGVISLDLKRGAVLGRVANGKVTIVNPVTATCEDLLVWEEDERADYVERLVRGDVRCEFSGRRMRFRVAAGEATVIVSGRNIYLSAAGRGTVSVRGAGGIEDGRYSVNGAPFESLPDEKKTFTLAAVTPTTGG